MATHNETINKWLGKRVAESWALGYQCVSWAKQYCKERGRSIGSFSGSAFNGWNTGSPFTDKNWKRINYINGFFPVQGDIVFFGKTKTNPYGHVAVVNNATPEFMDIIEQNAGNGSGDGKNGNAITIRTKNYINCLGWFHYQTSSERAKDIGIWNGEKPKSTPTRLEIATMLARGTRKAIGDIYNGERQNELASVFEINTMCVRAIGLYPKEYSREYLAGFIYDNKK